MVQAISTRQFHDAVPGDDWHRVYGGSTAYFVTGSFATGLELVNAIGELAEAANHHPDVDLRYGAVVVRLQTHETRGLSDRDVALALQISEAARGLGIGTESRQLHTVQIAIDALDIPKVLPFWEAVLAYDRRGDSALVDPRRLGPSVWFQQMDVPRPQRNRIHNDLTLPRAEAEGRIAAALAAGGTVANAEFAPHWWTLADPEGNEIDVAPWVDDTNPEDT
ncbi:MAG: VOC family protein [Humibacter sp.]